MPTPIDMDKEENLCHMSDAVPNTNKNKVNKSLSLKHKQTIILGNSRPPK